MLLSQSLKDLFYPPLCLSCKQWLIKGKSSLCFACLSQLPETRYTIDTKKSRAERWENVREVFICTTPELANKNILLVDNVITTGATLESAALALLKKKPKSIGVITLAFAND